MAKKRLKTENLQIQADEICENISDSIISVIETRARLIYRDYIEAPTKNGFLTNLGLSVAFLAPVVTADFKDFLFLSGDVLKAAFMLVALFFLCKTLKSAVDYFAAGRNLNVDNFIRDLKGQERYNVKASRKREEEKIEKIKRRYFREGYLRGRRR